MGTWSSPDTLEKVAKLEAVFSSELVAWRATEALYDLVGNDTLWDVLEEAGHVDPHADVRPLVAAYIEELVHWSRPSDFTRPWEIGARDRLEFIADRYADEKLPSLETMVVEDDAAAAAAHFAVLDGVEEDAYRHFAGRRIAPGAYAILDLDTDRIYRVECRYGLTLEIPEDMRDDLRARLFPIQAPSLH